MIFPIFYTFLSYQLLTIRLNGNEALDYWGAEMVEPMESRPKLILLGNELESDLDEDAKEERFLRVASHNRAILRKIFLFLYILSPFIGHYLSSKLLGGFWPIFHIVPVLAGVITLLSTSYGQLSFLPLLNLLTLFLINDKPHLLSVENTIPLYLLFQITAVVLYLNKRSTLRLEMNTQPLRIVKKAFVETFSFSILLISFFCLFDLIIPKRPWGQSENPPKAHQTIQKLNKNLSKVIKPPTQIEKKNLEQAIKTLAPKGLAKNHLANYLDNFGKQMDTYHDLLKSIAFSNLPIPEMEKNYLRNSANELSKEYLAIKDLLKAPGNLTAKDLDAIKNFITTLEDWHQNAKKSFNLSTKRNPFESLDSPKESFNQAIIDTENDLTQQIPKEKQAELQEAFQDLFMKEQINKDLVSVKTEDTFDSIEGIKLSAKKVREKELDTFLINPDLLEKILEISKDILVIFVIVLLVSFLQRFFQKDRIEGQNKSVKKEVKRSLLRRKQYKDIHEEIRDRYNIYLQAIKNLYFPESEPPPPKILEAFLIEKYKGQEKALTYFTEVFSQSFYGQKDLQSNIIKNYRKAFKVLVKSL